MVFQVTLENAGKALGAFFGAQRVSRRVLFLTEQFTIKLPSSSSTKPPNITLHSFTKDI